MEGSLTSNSAYSGVQKRSYQLENYCSQVQTLTTCKEWRHKTIQQHLCILHSVRNIGKHCRKDILNVLNLDQSEFVCSLVQNEIAKQKSD